MLLLANNQESHDKYKTDVMIYLPEINQISQEFESDPESTSDYGFMDKNGKVVITRSGILNKSILDNKAARYCKDPDDKIFIAIYYKNLKNKEL